MRHVGVRRVVGDGVDAGLRHDFARLVFLCQDDPSKTGLTSPRFGKRCSTWARSGLRGSGNSAIPMRIATYNVNGINGRLANLLGWLEEAAPDIVCLQELKAPDEKFPAPALRAAGYGAVWRGQKSWNGVAILARGAEPVETRRGLPRDPEDSHSRYIEAAVDGALVGW